jgi:5'-deoxynucleotidase YfbR-like HD superfamily hydrolase
MLIHLHLETSVDLLKVMKLLVVHDLPEAVTGDRQYFLGLVAPRSGRRREPRSAL